MRTCGPDCTPICDFCRWIEIQHGHHIGRCIHPGHPSVVALYDVCNDFYCYTLEVEP